MGTVTGVMQPTDAALVQRTLAGDTEGFNLLVKRYQRQVYNLCYRLVGNAEDACDLVQETFVRAYGALRTFRQDASFLTWLYKIASNVSIDLLRARRLKGAASLEEEYADGREPATSDRTASPEDMAMRGALSEIVQHEVMNLPERYRVVIVMRHLQGLSIEEIAETLRIPNGTVKTHLFRARAMLRGRIAPLLDMEDGGRA